MRPPRSSGEPALPATFWWLFAGQLLNALASFVFPFLTLFLKERGFTTEQAGLLVSGFGAGTVVAAPLAGMLADRLGRRPTILVSLVATGACAALLPALRSPAAIAAGAAGIGLFSNAYRPAAGATVADVVPPEGRSRAFGLLYWANNLGLAFSMTVGGGLAALGFTPLFLADAATTLLFALVVWNRVPETRPAAPGPGERAGGGYGEALRDPVLVPFLLLHLAVVVVLFQCMVTAPMDMVARGLTAGGYGRVLAVNGVLIVLLQPTMSRIAGRFDASRVLALGALLFGAGFGGYALARDGWGFAAATAVWTLGEILTLPTSAALVAALAPAALRGRYQGLYSLSFGVAMLIAPPLGSAVLQRLGSGALWWGCLAVTSAAAAGQLAVGGARRRRMAAGPA